MRPLSAPAPERNKGPILEVLERVLPDSGLVLEIASGTGQHVAHFARALPHLSWQPSDPDPRARASIAAWIAQTGVTNVLQPIDLDVRRQPWPVAHCDAIVCINMIHISPWTATQALFEGAARILADSGLVYLYGPYSVDGQHTAPSNAAFDASLRAQDPEWGVRDLNSVLDVAHQHGFELLESVPMPANNLSLVLREGNARQLSVADRDR
jgi:SAM-dependent methyltransferase